MTTMEWEDLEQIFRVVNGFEDSWKDLETYLQVEAVKALMAAASAYYVKIDQAFQYARTRTSCVFSSRKLQLTKSLLASPSSAGKDVCELGKEIGAALFRQQQANLDRWKHKEVEGNGGNSNSVTKAAWNPVFDSTDLMLWPFYTLMAYNKLRNIISRRELDTLHEACRNYVDMQRAALPGLVNLDKFVSNFSYMIGHFVELMESHSFPSSPSSSQSPLDWASTVLAGVRALHTLRMIVISLTIVGGTLWPCSPPPVLFVPDCDEANYMNALRHEMYKLCQMLQEGWGELLTLSNKSLPSPSSTYARAVTQIVHCCNAEMNSRKMRKRGFKPLVLGISSDLDLGVFTRGVSKSTTSTWENICTKPMFTGANSEEMAELFHQLFEERATISGCGT